MIAGASRRLRRFRNSSNGHRAIALALCVCSNAVFGGGVLPPPPAATPGDIPEIAIIIDDLGGRLDAGRHVIQLPGPVACAFLPYGAYTQQLAEQAHRRDKEVMLHLPMQTVEGHKLDAGGLTLDMTERQLVDTLQTSLARVPHASGINNHMGSLLTRHPGHMLWLLRAMRQDERLFFVDSRTTKHTVARQIAYENGVPSVSRDVFLDDDATPQAVQREFQRLLGLARRNGSALGIGHPHAATLDLLREELQQLSKSGVKLVPVARLVQHQQERDSLWRASLSP